MTSPNTARRLAGFAVTGLAILASVTAVAAQPLGVAAPPIVYVSRVFDADARTKAIDTVAVRATRGSLIFRDESGAERVLVDASAPDAPRSSPVDVADPDVSWDATRVVFAGFSEAEGAWRIFEIGIDGADLRQITRGKRRVDLARHGEAAALLERHDDLDPCYLPDGRICFVSTRYPGVAPDGRSRTTNLYVVAADGSDPRRITTERFGGDTPAVDPTTGHIVYSRWWRTSAGTILDADGANTGAIPPGSPEYGGGGGPFTEFGEDVLTGVAEEEFPGVNSWFLASIRPDGGDMKMLSGFHLDRAQTQAYRPVFYPSGAIVALFIPQTPVIGLPGPNGVRMFERGPSRPRPIDGPQDFSELAEIEQLQDPERADDADPGRPPNRTLYASAAPVSQSWMLVAARRSLPEDHDLYLLEIRNGNLEPLVSRPGSDELDAVPVFRRPVPPVVPDRAGREPVEVSPRTAEEAHRLGGSFTFLVENLHVNAPLDVPLPLAPPVGEDLTIEFWMAPPGESLTAVDPPVLLHAERVGPSGRVEVDLPAGVPLFEVLRRPDGEIARGRDGQIYHVGGMNFGRAGEVSRCVGCHAGHSMLAVPEAAEAAWTNLAASAKVSGSPRRESPEFPRELFEELGTFFGPERVVDRRTDPVSHWMTSLDDELRLELEWGVPIQARSVSVHGAEPSPEFMPMPVSDLFDMRIETSLGAGPRRQVAPPRRVPDPGTPVVVELDEQSAFDRMVLQFTLLEPGAMPPGFPVSVLSEVEVIARVSDQPRPPELRFRRGDSNCDGGVDITDAIVVLAHLFINGRQPCCEAAGDANADDRLEVTDAVRLLDTLFRGGSPLPSPSSACGDVARRTLGCSASACAD